MRRFCIVLISYVVAILLSDKAGAQVFHLSSDMLNITSSIKLSVQDSASKAPIPYASVFLVPQKDSIITSFTMTDTLGRASLANVTRGSYLLNIELIGFRPVQKEIYVRENQDLGKFFLAEEKQALQGAEVTAYVSPITSVKDTLTYNAAAFGAMESEMLGDLLKRMPGMDVDDKGNVKVNGESIKKITVQGRTFFFDDKKTALSNLPAKIVDKIRVIDKESERAEITGIPDAKKEKVMDLELKEEFKKGFFGNLGIKGGATVASSGAEDALRGGRDFLYNTNALAAAYREKSQLTVVGNANNVDDQDASVTVIFYSADDDEVPTLPGGIRGNAQLGANLNTDLGGGYTLDGTVNLNSSSRDAAAHSLRASGISAQGGIITETTSSTTERNDAFTVKMKLKNGSKSRISLSFTPEFSLGGGATDYTSVSDVSSDQSVSRTSRVIRSAENGSRSTGGSFVSSIRNMGRKGRTLSLEAEYDLRSGESTEQSDSDYSDAEKVSLIYSGETSNRSLSSVITYTEPLFKNVSLQAKASASHAVGSRIRSAADRGGDAAVGERYSSAQGTSDTEGGGTLLLKWSKNSDYVTVGTGASYSKKMTRATSHGMTAVTGDEWIFNLNPTITVSKGLPHDISTYARYSGSLQNPARTSMLPVLDISNANSITAGNIFLRRPYRHGLSAYISKNGKSSFNISVNGSVTQNAVVSASWYGEDRIRYAVPVNSQASKYSMNGHISMARPLDKKGRFNLSLYITPTISASSSYQARGILQGLDINSFDYAQFMNEFWGADASGANFYSGRSGFGRSRTLTMSLSGQAIASYRNKNMSANIRFQTANNRSSYSLDPTANSNTWQHTFGSYLQYRLPYNINLTSIASYSIYRGYRSGFNDPQLSWDVRLEKSIKAFTLMLSGHDLFNSARSISHNSAEDWYEDTDALVLGRNVMLGIRWNFGKSNRGNMSRAQSAALNMLR